ncbi:MAG: helix-turn-helix domain-containing protein [Betaproteobacteria bacterium]|nr:helix-turn-helix domain-containing protein [Betaproteobacteria bacterium]
MGGERKPGTQSIERAVCLLKALSTRHRAGWQLADLAAQCGLKKSTAHRILNSLSRERLVSRHVIDGHYLPGPLLFELGLALPGLGNFQREARERLEEFARRTGGVASLYLRSGDDTVCAIRLGDSPVTGLSSRPAGSRTPMALSTGGTAILIALPLEESRAVIARNFATLAHLGAKRLDDFRRVIKRSPAEGLCVNAGVAMPGINIFGMAVLDAGGRPFASVSLAGTPKTFPAARLAEFRKWLDREARALGECAARALGDA